MMDLEDETRIVERGAARDTLLSTLLPFDRTGPRAARRFVEAAVRRLRLDEALGATLVLVASELTTNAVVHGCGPVALTVAYRSGEVTIEVADGDPRCERVRPRPADDAGHGGRGLRLLDALTDAWGVRSMPTGKAVWARRRVTD
jgi:anti-sigma regulatory factor (Ser/Thr protein kinase)